MIPIAMTGLTISRLHNRGSVVRIISLMRTTAPKIACFVGYFPLFFLAVSVSEEKTPGNCPETGSEMGGYAALGR